MAKDPYQVLIRPFVKEKTYDHIEKENKLDFMVNRRANKKEVKAAVEKLFDVKVEGVWTYIAKDGKHAIVKLTKDYPAEELAMKVGAM